MGCFVNPGYTLDRVRDHSDRNNGTVTRSDGTVTHDDGTRCCWDQLLEKCASDIM